MKTAGNSGGQLLHRTLIFCSILFNKPFTESGDIFGPLPERRNFYSDNVEPKVKVFPKMPLL
jgi:hypothetical protein